MEEETASVEERAKSMGWVPQEEFRGNPDNWRSAEEFVGLAEVSLPHLKGTLKVMEETIAEQKRTMEAMRNDFGEFVEMSRSAEQRAEERAFKRAIEELRKEQNEAKNAGDMERFIQATEAIDQKLAEGAPAATGTEAKTEQDAYQKWLKDGEKDFKAWQDENKWFFDEPDMFAYARQMDDFLQAKFGYKISRGERLGKLTELVKKKFPDHFGNPARKAGSPVEGATGGKPSSSGNGKTFQDLPPEAQKQAIKWCGKDGKGTGTIPNLTFSDFLKSYKW